MSSRITKFQNISNKQKIWHFNTKNKLCLPKNIKTDTLTENQHYIRMVLEAEEPNI